MMVLSRYFKSFQLLTLPKHAISSLLSNPKELQTLNARHDSLVRSGLKKGPKKIKNCRRRSRHKWWEEAVRKDEQPKIFLNPFVRVQPRIQCWLAWR
jgi:hypothetical protein